MWGGGGGCGRLREGKGREIEGVGGVRVWERSSSNVSATRKKEGKGRRKGRLREGKGD